MVKWPLFCALTLQKKKKKTHIFITFFFTWSFLIFTNFKPFNIRLLKGKYFKCFCKSRGLWSFQEIKNKKLAGKHQIRRLSILFLLIFHCHPCHYITTRQEGLFRGQEATTSHYGTNFSPRKRCSGLFGSEPICRSACSFFPVVKLESFWFLLNSKETISSIYTATSKVPYRHRHQTWVIPHETATKCLP